MQLLQQPKHSNTCGHHCVAMITGYPLYDVVLRIGHVQGTSAKAITKVLNVYGYDVGQTIRIKSFEENLPALCMLTIHFERAKHTHWVVYNEGAIYDPGYPHPYDYNENNFSLLEQRATSYIKIEKINGRRL